MCKHYAVGNSHVNFIISCLVSTYRQTDCMVRSQWQDYSAMTISFKPYSLNSLSLFWWSLFRILNLKEFFNFFQFLAATLELTIALHVV